MAGAFDAGIGAIAGSALYNILVIPAVSVFVGGPLAIQKQVVRRDGFLYVAVVVALIAVIWLGPSSTEGTTVKHFMSPWVGVGGIIVYLGYVAVLITQARKGSLRVHMYVLRHAALGALVVDADGAGIAVAQVHVERDDHLVEGDIRIVRRAVGQK